MNSGIRPVALVMNLLFLAVLSCTTPVQLTEGNSSETVIGRVVKSDGSPACSTIVVLYPADHDPEASLSDVKIPADTTDSDGNYRIAAPDSTEDYSIVATDPQSGDRALLTGITVNGETTSAPDAVLSLPGAIRVAIPESSVGGYAYIPGTGISANVNSSGMITLDKVPAGTIPAVKYVSGTSSEVLISGIEVISGDTAIIPYPQWRYSIRAYLNTTVSGAGITGDLTDFPILIRLTENMFDFSQAQTHGEDLRFSDANGNHLTHEIELWDAVKNIAAIWVRIPVVFGNDDSQYIVMHWGTSGSKVSSFSNSAAVFDTLAGFQGVWHLSGSGNDTAFDATANRFHGTPFNMNLSSAVEGATGYSRYFNGKSSYITIPGSASGNLDIAQNSDYSMSLWAYADTIDTLWHALAGKGHEQYYLKLKCYANGKGTWEFVEYQDKQGWAFTEDSIPPSPGAKEWVYLTGVRSGTEQYLYINGVMVNDSTPLMAGDYPRISTDDFTIGKHARQVTIPGNEGWCYFRGKIDEVRVMSTAVKADWIRLCYMNQKAEDKLVEFR